MLLDEKSPDMNQPHHNIGSIYTGEYTFKPAEIINFAREFDLRTFSVDNKSDITLGNISIEDGAAFRFGTDDRLYNNRSTINAYKNSDLAEFVGKLMEDK